MSADDTTVTYRIVPGFNDELRAGDDGSVWTRVAPGRRGGSMTTGDRRH